MRTVGKARRHWNYSNKCSRKVSSQPITFVGVLNSCASLISLEEARCAHKQIIERGYESNVFLGNSLVDMYAKCGSMDDACKVFNKMPSRDVVSCNALFGGYAMHGQGKIALKHFKLMWRRCTTR
jgi:pentatricopeptide repeat protein